LLISVSKVYYPRRRRTTAERISRSLCHDVCIGMGVYVRSIKRKKPHRNDLKLGTVIQQFTAVCRSLLILD